MDIAPGYLQEELQIKELAAVRALARVADDTLSIDC